MSIKDFFNKSVKTISAKSLNSLGEEVESADNVRAAKKRLSVFLPPLDYSSASNFAVYGSAKKYYTDSVKRIYLQYPYDGSEKEINEYILSSSYLDQYVFNQRYPRTNGNIILSADAWGTRVIKDSFYGAPATASYEYISFKGGPNTSINPNDPIASAFTGSHNQNNIFDLSKNRGSNLALNPASGSTVEFWMKKTEFMGSGTTDDRTRTEVILDVWNNTSTGSDSYGRLKVELDGAQTYPFKVTYRSGSNGLINAYLGSTGAAKSDITGSSSWRHYAITFASSSNANEVIAKLYVNGVLNDTTSSASPINEITGALTGYIGALQTVSMKGNAGTSVGGRGWGKLSASLDEFRYWKSERTAREIGRNYWTQVRGGTNTDDSNTDLGVYFKFNEGITGNSSIDSTVLDYSGRISNGSWTGYGTNSRNTESAIVLAGAATEEYRDPIIYPEHPDVSHVLSELRSSGSAYDQANNSSIINSLPAWISEDDSNENLQNLVQIVASYFDRLQSQIGHVPRLKNITYLSSSYVSPSFSSNLVNSSGLMASEIFIDAEVVAQILSRDDNRGFDLDLEEIKNRIYQNIYNNLIYINKSKGTEKSFRNLIHCYGVDEKLIRLNTYGDNVTYKFRDNFRSSVVTKNVVDFSGPTRNDATVYQMTASSNSNSVSFISGTIGGGFAGKEDYIGFTLEGEFIFPKKKAICETTSSIGNSILSSSIFGMHTARPETPADTAWATNDYADIRILAIREDALNDVEDVKFMLTSSVAAIPTITTDIFKNVYDNKKWNFAVRVINEKYPIGDSIEGAAYSGSSPATSSRYKLEFYGVNQTLDIVNEEFFLTEVISTVAGKRVLEYPKRLFAGAHRTNFSGTVLQSSDVKLSNVKYWSSYIPNEVIRAHARDTDNYGTLRPHRNAFLTQNSLTNGTYIPEIETLALNWNFYNITGSNSLGHLDILDSSSGSAGDLNRYGWLGGIVKPQHTAIGKGFEANDKEAVSKEYIYSAKQSAPELVHTSEMINILDADDENFTKEQRPSHYYFAIEKSMYQVISDEMLNTFATIVEFNNLIGDPVNRYRQDYKLLSKARSLYFEKVQNNPDLDRFIEFYKWIDSSLSVFLQQLIPASADSSNNIRTLIESHILERNKYWTKFPTLEKIDPGGPGGLEFPAAALGGGTSDSPYRSRDGANAVLDRAPIPYMEKEHAPYWKKKASRLTGPLASGDAAVDRDRQDILEVLQTGYNRDTNRPFALNKNITMQIHGGTNYPRSKNRQIVLNATYPDGPRAASGTPLNAILIDDVHVEKSLDIIDVIDPNEKKSLAFKCSIRREDEIGLPDRGRENYTSVMKGTIAAPFNLISGSVVSGYNSIIDKNFKSGTILTNLHSDAFINNETAMQGPFTDAHVGGHESRHVDLNKYDASKEAHNNYIDSKNNRPEAWQILPGRKYGTDETFLGIVGPDYPNPYGPYPYTRYKLATRYRNVGAKRPVNIRNIHYTTASAKIGNFTHNYEIVQTAGRTKNNRYFVKHEGVALPDANNYSIDFQTLFPETTTLSTLLGLKHGANTFGNFFGVKFNEAVAEPSNRYEIMASFSTIFRSGSASKSIFVNKFSAPGGPEVNTEIFLDLAAAEKSVYNALPYRNLSVRSSGSGEDGTIRVQDQLNKRRGLRTLLSLHAGQFGHDAEFGSVVPTEYVSKPSYHKVNRNIGRRIKFSGISSYGDYSFATGTVFDSPLITHPIPRSDLQYSWITSSYEESRIYGHTWNEGEISSSAGIKPSISFTKESHISAGGIRVDFANINSIIYDPIDIDNNILSASNEDYRNTNLATLSTAEMLNGLLLHRNGPYGVNTWKQVRVGESSLARVLKKRNIISHFRKMGHEFPLKKDVISRPHPIRGSLRKFTETPIVSKYNPLVQNISIKSTTLDGREITSPVQIETSYGNSLSYFNNVELNNLYSDQIDQQTTVAYDSIRDLYVNDQVQNEDSPVNKFNSIIYKERVYPSSINAFSSSVRTRQSFTSTFWKDYRPDRRKVNVNSFNETIVSQSMWSMDADEDFLTRKANERTGANPGAPGVLQNNYSQIHRGTLSSVKASVQYARRHTMQNARSTVGPEGIILPATGTGYSGINSYVPLEPEQMFAGQTLWETANQAGKSPWYNSYSDYINEMRTKGKDYSIVPEFRISDHVEMYVKANSGNFLSDKLNIFKIEGGDSDRQDSTKENFFKTYTNSDFLKFFKIIKSDHTEVGKPKSLTLKCNALLKFLPYDGFYPSERTVQMAEMFSASYGNYINYEVGNGSGINTNQAFRTFMAPMFAPGVMYNTIKSGMAVDYPVFTSSIDTHTTSDDSNNYGDKTVYISGSEGVGKFGLRIPFEALVEPEAYLTDVTLHDMEVHPSASMNVTASWNGQGGNLYKLMASNFLAECVDFFLPEGKLTSIVSKPDRQWESAEKGKVYAARIKIRKSYNKASARTGSADYSNPLTPVTLWRSDYHETFTMYSRPSAFGPPVGGGPAYTKGYGSANGFNPCYTPPYYYGESWVDVFFTAPSSGKVTVDDLLSPTNLAASYIRIGNEWAISGAKARQTALNTMLHIDNVEFNSMQLDAVCNLFGKAEIKNVTYDPETGKPLEVKDGASTTTDDVWVVQTKFETPMLNFVDSLNGGSQTVTNPTYGSASVARGMWHQYGKPPAAPDIGVFLQVTDIPQTYIENALGGTSATGSLIDLVGMATEEKRLGEVADNKVVREAVIAVPYVEKGSERKFFEISKKDIDEALLGNPNVSDSITQMVESMGRYIIPPKMDFIENPDVVSPFAMYIFEFEHILNKDDLVDIWQGLPPRIGQSFDTESHSFKSGTGPHTRQVVKETQISHPLLVGEILNDDNLPDNIRWMVFKVKQKASKNYFDKVIKDQINPDNTFDKGKAGEIGRKDSSKRSSPKYTYNWPYDFFSLVELVKIDAEVEISGDTSADESMLTKQP
tara:strand:+ start:11969 stop:20794 length:8826 start_codon:yes stop_codon:yes gene_type:complete